METLALSGNQSTNRLAHETGRSQAPALELTKNALGEQTFLQRAEALRLGQAYACDLDLRRLVSEPCKRYRYQRRTYWLDARSHKLFVDGLKQNGGVFTVATYEAILASTHSSAELSQAQSQRSPNPLSAELAAKRKCESSPRQLHEVIRLGHFDNRRKGRLKYSTRALLIGEGPIVQGRTRDISETGMQVRVPLLGDCKIGDTVTVELLKHPETRASGLRFRVMRIVQRDNELIIGLGCEASGDTHGTTFLRSLIERLTGGDRGLLEYDVEGAALTAKSLMAKRHYMPSTALIPFFLAGKELHSAQVTAIAHNEISGQALFAYRTGAVGNALFEAINRRHLRHFRKLARVDRPAVAMLAVWRSSDAGNLVTHLDVASKTDTEWYTSLAAHRHEEQFRAFRVIVRQARAPHARYLQRELAPLAAKSSVLAKQLLRDAEQVAAVGALLDVTDEVRAWNLAPYESQDARQEAEDCRARLIRKPKPLPIRYVDTSHAHSTGLLRLDVTLEVLGRTIPAVTSDISPTGLSVVLPEEVPPLTRGTPVQVTFSGLMERAGILSRLQRIPERVSYQVAWSDFEEEHLMRLRLQEPEQQRAFTRVLDAYLKKERSSVRADRTTAFRLAVSRLYSALFAEASITLPLLYFGPTTTGYPLAQIGVTQTPSPLAAFFEATEGRYDFSALTAPERTARLWNQVVRNGRAEMTVFLVKERAPGEPRYGISSIADFEFEDLAEMRKFLDYAIDMDLRIIKIVLLPARVPSSAEAGQMLSGVEKHSATEAEKLREDFNKLIAVGDVVDITTTSHELRYLVPDVVANRDDCALSAA